MEHIYKFLKDIKPRKYQEEIFKTCSKKNCLVVLPTGLGKTLIALMLTIDRMHKHPGEKVVFLAPTKPLVEQHLKTFKEILPELFAEITIFTGKVKSGERKKLWQRGDIVFSTPQCLANDLKKGLYNLKDVCLLVEDEAHRCVKNYDYNFLAEKYKSQSENPRILGLTASPGNESEKVKKICNNLSIQEVELRTRESEDVKPYLQEREFEKHIVNLPGVFEDIRKILEELINKYLQELKNRKVLFKTPNKTELIKLQGKVIENANKAKEPNKKFNYFHAASAIAQVIKLQHAQELLETQTLEGFIEYLRNLFTQASEKKSKGVQKLVKTKEFNYLYNRAIELKAKGFEHPKLEEIRKIIKKEILSENISKGKKAIIFTQFRETASKISEELESINGINTGVFVGQAKKTSNSKNNSKNKKTNSSEGLNQKKQKQMISDFSEGEINVLISTSIGEEGLDIPEVNSVIFYEPIPSAIRSIQRKGRTARLMKGKMIMLITKKTKDEIFYYISKSREKQMESTIGKIKKELSDSSKKEDSGNKQSSLDEF